MEVEKLIKKLEDKNSDVRLNAAKALAEMGDKSAVSYLRKAWKEDKEKKVQVWSAYALVKIEKNIDAFGFLITEALKDKSGTVRYRATQVLEKIGEAAIQPLIEALKDKDVLVRGSAAQVLGKIKDKKVVKPLIELLKDKDEYVCSYAASALGSIGDEKT